jgi:hypothetical protein
VGHFLNGEEGIRCGGEFRGYDGVCSPQEFEVVFFDADGGLSCVSVMELSVSLANGELVGFGSLTVLLPEWCKCNDRKAVPSHQMKRSLYRQNSS